MVFENVAVLLFGSYTNCRKGPNVSSRANILNTEQDRRAYCERTVRIPKQIRTPRAVCTHIVRISIDLDHSLGQKIIIN